jgi:hypothetical protein
MRAAKILLITFAKYGLDFFKTNKMGFWYKAHGFSVRNSNAASGFKRVGYYKETFNAQSSVLPL